MADKNDALEYNHKILSQERKRQKISQEIVASQLTLNVNQIKSLENNLNSGFIAPHFKLLALKRYAKFLEIDFDKIITPNIPTKEEVVDDQIETNLPLSPKFNKRFYFNINLLILVIIGLIFAYMILQNTDSDSKNSDNNKVIIQTPPSVKKSLVDNIIAPVTEDFLEKEMPTISNEDTQLIKKISDVVSIEFLCSISSASMDKIWSREKPEKPATYFHIISQKKQSICTIDNQGNFKQYDLDKGSKVTHRGEAPFKIQLDPSISELYFQGWRVILNENDIFVQLNPVKMSTDLN